MTWRIHSTHRAKSESPFFTARRFHTLPAMSNTDSSYHFSHHSIDLSADYQDIKNLHIDANNANQQENHRRDTIFVPNTPADVINKALRENSVSSESSQSLDVLPLPPHSSELQSHVQEEPQRHVQEEPPAQPPVQRRPESMRTFSNISEAYVSSAQALPVQISQLTSNSHSIDKFCTVIIKFFSALDTYERAHIESLQTLLSQTIPLASESDFDQSVSAHPSWNSIQKYYKTYLSHCVSTLSRLKSQSEFVLRRLPLMSQEISILFEEFNRRSEELARRYKNTQQLHVEYTSLKKRQSQLLTLCAEKDFNESELSNIRKAQNETISAELRYCENEIEFRRLFTEFLERIPAIFTAIHQLNASRVDGIRSAIDWYSAAVKDRLQTCDTEFRVLETSLEEANPLNFEWDFSEYTSIEIDEKAREHSMFVRNLYGEAGVSAVKENVLCFVKMLEKLCGIITAWLSALSLRMVPVPVVDVSILNVSEIQSFEGLAKFFGEHSHAVTEFYNQIIQIKTSVLIVCQADAVLVKEMTNQSKALEKQLTLMRKKEKTVLNAKIKATKVYSQCELKDSGDLMEKELSMQKCLWEYDSAQKSTRSVEKIIEACVLKQLMLLEENYNARDETVEKMLSAMSSSIGGYVSQCSGAHSRLKSVKISILTDLAVKMNCEENSIDFQKFYGKHGLNTAKTFAFQSLKTLKLIGEYVTENAVKQQNYVRALSKAAKLIKKAHFNATQQSVSKALSAVTVLLMDTYDATIQYAEGLYAISDELLAVRLNLKNRLKACENALAKTEKSIRKMSNAHNGALANVQKLEGDLANVQEGQSDSREDSRSFLQKVGIKRMGRCIPRSNPRVEFCSH